MFCDPSSSVEPTYRGSITARALAHLDRVGEQADIIIDMPLGINGALEVVTHLPPIIVGRQVNQFPDVSFKLEKHTRLIMITGIADNAVHCSSSMKALTFLSTSQ
jgi:hypothetical protein